MSSRVNGILGVSRAIGDALFKGNRQPEHLWICPDGTNATLEFSADLVSAAPEVVSYPLLPGDSLLILACDGLWEVLTPEEASLVAREELARGVSLNATARRLVETAFKLGSNDNITALLVLLPTSTLSRGQPTV
ncbi:protein serine/threonine phosphatase 2C family protein [archaeon]|nr:MAG: protein serine/threonine phosphatase 2C family protein [archaeon]